ncbi:hypothetical protein AURDEDRAFT_152678 [Auricularia subglabra TFB-10046 SS5]|nr:hypothetical protein AURDEDRAFT_152678 [Auricularia subglabra TFB-10046 SS5]
MAPLPEDILLSVFDAVASYTPGLVSMEDIDARGDRSDTLASAALVCRSWAACAQRVLFRDIFLPSTTILSRDEFSWPVVRRSTETLHALVRALEQGHAQFVRALHLGFGEVPGCDVDHESRWNSYLEDDREPQVRHLELVARAISLCPRLAHLSLYIGTPFDVDDLAFPPGAIARISGLRHLRQLTLCNLSDASYNDRYSAFLGDYVLPGFALGHQVIKTFRSQLAVLELDYMADERRIIRSEPLSLPKLHTFRAGHVPPELRAVLQHKGSCPSLKHVYLDVASSVDYLPRTITSLTLRSPFCENLSHLHTLKSLALIETRRDCVVDLLATTSRTLTNLEMCLDSMGWHEDAANLEELLNTLPAVRRLVVLGPRPKDIDYTSLISKPIVFVDGARCIFPWNP